MIKTKSEYKLYRIYRFSVMSLCLLILLFYACNGAIKPYIRPDADLSGIKSVAVLPINNHTADQYAAEKIRSIVIMEILSRGIDVTQPGEVIRALDELKIKSVNSIVIDDIQRIGKLLNVDAVIIGSVETFGISKGITVSYPEVSINLRMHDSATGNIISSVWHTTGGASFWTRHFGTEGNTLDEASQKVVRESFDAFF